MATRSTGKTTGRSTSSTARKSSSTGRKTATGNRSTSKMNAPVQRKMTLFARIKSNPVIKRIMAPVIFVIVVLAIVAFDLLFTWNDYSKFFKFLGVEILAAVIVWVLKAVFTKSKSSDEPVSGV